MYVEQERRKVKATRKKVWQVTYISIFLQSDHNIKVIRDYDR